MNTQPLSENTLQKQVLETVISAFDDTVVNFESNPNIGQYIICYKSVLYSMEFLYHNQCSEDMVQEFVDFALTTIPVQPYSKIIKEDWRGENSELGYLMDNLQSLHECCEKIPKEKKTEIIDYMKNLQSLANGDI